MWLNGGMTEIDPLEIAQLSELPAVKTAFDRWQDARKRHAEEPWNVSLATVEIMKARWAHALREAQS